MRGNLAAFSAKGEELWERHVQSAVSQVGRTQRAGQARGLPRDTVGGKVAVGEGGGWGGWRTRSGTTNGLDKAQGAAPQPPAALMCLLAVTRAGRHGWRCVLRVLCM